MRQSVNTNLCWGDVGSSGAAYMKATKVVAVQGLIAASWEVMPRSARQGTPERQLALHSSMPINADGKVAV
jgi:hypothetical protein